MKCYGRWLALACALATAGCNGDSLTVPPTKGILEVTTLTGGAEPDADGYTLQVNGGPAEAIGPSATWRSAELDPGSYTVQVAGLSPNCSVAENPRTVTITGGETARVAFQVTCSATTGSVQVSASTSGASPDADGYTLVVDGADRGALGSTGTLDVTGLTPGDHMVGLSGVAGNCQVGGDNPRVVVVAAGASASAAFTVSCGAPPPDAGSLRVTTTTTGPDPDADGYAIALDGGTSQPIGTSAQATLTNLAAGPHSIQLSGLAANCSVQGTNPRSVSIVSGATAEVSFTVTCAATSGSVQVSVTTSGSPTDPDGYTVKLDGRDPGLSIGTSGNVSFTAVPAGSHTAALTGVAANCSVAGGATQSVTVTAASEAPVSFVVSCSAPGLIWRPMSGGGGGELANVWGTGPSDVFAVGSNSSGEAVIIHYDGTSWSEQLRRPNPFGPSAFNGIWANTPTDVYAAGIGVEEGTTGSVYHYDGSGWTPMTLPPVGADLMFGVWGLSGTAIFAFGAYQYDRDEYRPMILRYDGTAWQTFPVPQGDMYISGMWGTSATDLYAAGGRFGDSPSQLVVHYDGTSWSVVQETSSGQGAAYAVWGSSPTDVYVGQDTPPLLHYDGSTWSPATVPSPAPVFGVWGTSATDVFATSGGAVLHYDGAAWTSTPTLTPHLLHSLWGSSPTDVFAVGENGTILHGTQ